MLGRERPIRCRNYQPRLSTPVFVRECELPLLFLRGSPASRNRTREANGDARAHNGRKPSYARKRFKSVGEDRERREVVGLAMSLMVQMKGHTPLI